MSRSMPPLAAKPSNMNARRAGTAVLPLASSPVTPGQADTKLPWQAGASPATTNLKGARETILLIEQLIRAASHGQDPVVVGKPA
ncbi:MULTISPECIES: hypothetical protein [Frankia]|uniref:hypothetical protein n=1 Tax=Frankia TaxID=1854 RepID=UPI0012FDB3A2|nr:MULTISPECIES: hypothetical protein [Frankia]